MKTHWLDRVTSHIAPSWTLQRQRARIASAMFARHYDAASTGRRTSGWRRSSADINSVIGPAIGILRDSAEDLVRNNPFAESAVSTIADHAVGWGLTAKPATPNAGAVAAWSAWAETTACDADGRNNIYGLQKLVQRSVVVAGEAIIRLRVRRPEDGLPLPIQLQVLDPAFLDTSKDVDALPNGGRIVQGVEFDPIGRRSAYWLFREHPGSLLMSESNRIPAEFVAHVFRQLRPGQVRGVSWYAPVLLRFRDFDDLEDAQLMKQKIAACLAVIMSDPDGSLPSLGTADDTATPAIDSLEPGAIMNVPPGRSIDIVQPPRTDGYAEYSKTVLRAIATGLGVTYEDITGDYENLPFSAARMSRLRHWARVEDWRWRILIPQFCDPVWTWAMQAAVVMGQVKGAAPAARWTGSPAPMIDPAAEGLAYQRNIRTGIQSLSDAIRERGYDPAELLAEISADNKTLDKLGIILDSDPRKMTQAGQLQGEAAGTPGAAPPKDNGMARFADFLARLPEGRAVEMLSEMFGERQ